MRAGGKGASPGPATKSALPDWLRRLSVVDKGRFAKTESTLTVKRGLRFLDALRSGWILPLATMMRLEVRTAGPTADAGWEFDKVMASNHAPFQAAGDPSHPRLLASSATTGPCGPHRAGPDCSSPLKRPQPAFECLAGVVDTDLCPTHIHVPFFAAARGRAHDRQARL